MDHDRDDIPRDPPQEWLDALERSEAELAAGRVVSGDAVRKRLRASIARMEARLEPEPETAPSPAPRR